MLQRPIIKTKPYKPVVEKREHYVFVPTQSIDEITERPIVELQQKKFDNNHLSMFKINDFCIENLLISGSIDTLSRVNLERDSFSSIAQLENVAQTIVENDLKKNSKTE